MLPSSRLEFQARSMRSLLRICLGVSAGGLFGDLRPPDSGQVRAVALGQIEGDVRAIVVEEFAVIADRPAVFRHLPDIVADRYPCLGQWDCGFFDFGERDGLGQPDTGGGIGHSVFRPAPFAVHDEAVSGDERLEAVLESSKRDRGSEGAQDLLRRSAAWVAAHGFFDSLQCVVGDLVCQAGLSCAGNLRARMGRIRATIKPIRKDERSTRNESCAWTDFSDPLEKSVVRGCRQVVRRGPNARSSGRFTRRRL